MGAEFKFKFIFIFIFIFILLVFSSPARRAATDESEAAVEPSRSHASAKTKFHSAQF
jgi:hypothetical protein